ncbi:hypothetical protein [Microseira wollei]|uniref:hypothetical protein n=1 Tax=Microseira wollei TaxID=467598 RepID=UPI001CFE24CF|nr:hypothetical protein [Microseira wollei]
MRARLGGKVAALEDMGEKCDRYYHCHYTPMSCRGVVAIAELTHARSETGFL